MPSKYIGRTSVLVCFIIFAGNCFHVSSVAIVLRLLATETLPDGNIINSPLFNRCSFAFLAVSILFLIVFYFFH